jgi:orotate phosphoribosyltransferase-like protein
MPKRKYDDEVLRARALELRAKGLSYREIAGSLVVVFSRFTSLYHLMRVLGLRLSSGYSGSSNVVELWLLN